MRTLTLIGLPEALLFGIVICRAAFGADTLAEASGAHPAATSTNGILSGFKLNLPEQADAPQLLLAMREAPAGWATLGFAMAAWDCSSKLERLQGEQRKTKAAEMVPLLREANAILDTALQVDPGNTNLPVWHHCLKPLLPMFLFEAGTNDLDEVGTLARQALSQNTNTDSLLSGATSCMLNELLGRLALRQNKADQARVYLRAAGKAAIPLMTASFNALEAAPVPAVNKFSALSPLARELLEHGDNEDREAVLGFLDDIASSIQPELLNPKAQRFAAEGLKQLKDWRQQIREGKIPSDPK